MRRTTFHLSLMVLVTGLATPAVAQIEADGRFALQPVPDGVLRLDRRTGEVSFCRRDGETWACRAVADDRRALNEEIARLERENADLRRRAERRPLVEGPSMRLPSDAEIDEALGLMERFMDRARRMMERWRTEPPGQRT
jgi:hypothetical protein